MYSQRSQGAVLGTVKKGFAVVSICRLMFDLLGHKFIWKEWCQKRGRNGMPPTYIASRALNEKLPNP
jgi:hypothetical protein